VSLNKEDLSQGGA